MCGIVGYIGKKKVLPILIQGLKKLEYRGYDSAGVAFIVKDHQTKICKSVGRIAALEKVIPMNEEAFLGIGHTRWATHGGVTKENSHPHQVGDITIVHNGILENYLELKNELMAQGYLFQGDTDTEVACAYMDYLYKKSKSKNMIEILEECMKTFIGSYAFAILVQGQSQLFVMKKDSPLIIGLGEDENYVASDISAYGEKTSWYIPLEDMEIGIISEHGVQIFQHGQEVHPVKKRVDRKFQDSEKNGFDHFMLKEIYEQQHLVEEWSFRYFEQKLLQKLPDIRNYKRIHIIGCGTAYHAGLVGKYLLEEENDIEVNVFIASEYRYQKLFIDPTTLVIAVSQSGETADTLASIKRVQKYQVHTLGIVNVPDSSIARCVDEVIYTEAGPEIAVASTKAYTSQLFIFGMLALKIHELNDGLNFASLKKDYQLLGTLLQNLIQFNYQPIVDLLFDKDNVFYLGRNIDYVTGMEGSLKLKEISYIHSEAMPAGELKHGTISLMDEDSCVIVLITKEELASKTISNIKEVHSRGAKVILLATDSLREKIDPSCYHEVIWLPKVSPYIQPIVNTIPLQMIAYEVAKKRGLDIDKPRNLAKSVTVE